MRYAIVLLLFFLGFAVAYAPASLLRRYTNDVPGLDIVDPAGTLWSGNGTLVADGRVLGRATWRIRPLAALKLHGVYDVRVFNDNGSLLEGSIDIGFQGLTLDAAGTVDTQTLNQVLQTWQLSLSGDLDVKHVVSRWRDGRLDSLDGELGWAGGQALFNNPGGPGQATLPMLTAVLTGDGQGGLSAILVSEGEQTPLVQARLAADGMLKVDITKRMTRLLGTPWRGDEPDHAVVISLEETVLGPP
ncbi:MAG: type II secretion system protein N [Pseudomonadales bacterium]|nr:type II secretion system protein N [Pseudomonadales bacterium]MCP5182821.1 type II secretion system protein N [Pseudomonadales bacterium]